MRRQDEVSPTRLVPEAFPELHIQSSEHLECLPLGSNSAPGNRLFRSNARFPATGIRSGSAPVPERPPGGVGRDYGRANQHSLQIRLISRWKVKPAPSTTSLFSGMSLVRTQTPDAMASNNAKDKPSSSDGSTNSAAFDRSSSRSSPETHGRKRIASDSWPRRLVSYESVWLDPPASTSFISVCRVSKASIRRWQFFSGENLPRKST